MNLKEKITSLLQQGGLYRSQGLLIEAIAKFEEAVDLLQQQKQLKNKDDLIAGIQKKIQGTQAELDRFESAEATPEVSSKIQDLIKRQFAFSDDADESALEGAIALAKFGQFQRALDEFGLMLERDPIRVAAAKNIIRCHMALDTADMAISQFEDWLTQERFSPEEISKVGVFFKGTLSRAGIDKALPGSPAPVMDAPTIEMADTDTGDAAATGTGIADIQLPEMDNDEILDINSIGMMMEAGPRKGEMIELNVSFQNGDIISILIPGSDTAVISYLEIDRTLDNVQFYSPMAIFSGSGNVRAKSRIESGPRRGDYNVDIKVIY